MVSIRFLVSGAGVLDRVPSGPAVDHPARPEPGPEVRELLLGRVVVLLGLLLGVEVVEVAEELVEAVVGGQELVAVAEVVLAELAGRVALLLERGRDRSGPRRCRPRFAPGMPDLGQTRADTGSVRR